MKRIEIKHLLTTTPEEQEVVVMGWVRTFRARRFIILNDGSTINTLQVVVDFEQFDEELLKRINTGASLKVTGTLVASQGSGQAVEVLATAIEVLGDSDPGEYKLQPKKHSLEFLREQAHFRMRTNTFSAVFRIRHALAFAVHQYYHERGFYCLHSPIITGSDAEGAGEMFRVTTFSLFDSEQVKSYKVSKFNKKELKELKKIADSFYEDIFLFLEEKRLLKLFLEAAKSLFGLSLKELITANPEKLDAINDQWNSKYQPIYLDNPLEYFAKKHNLDAESFKRIHDIDTGKLLENFKKRVSKTGNNQEGVSIKIRDKIKSLLKKVNQSSSSKLEINKLENRFKFHDNPFITFSFFNLISEIEKLTIDYKNDFFGKPTNLTVSGQLQAEVGALALGKVYTFGPTFRAENSNTVRHLAEFWMIEPEVAFFDIQDNMDLAEDFVKYLVNYVLEHYPDDLAVLDQRIQQLEKNMPKAERRPMGLLDTLRFVVDNEFERITYTDAVNILRNSKPYKKKRFQYPVEWGLDLQSEHERYLVEKKFSKPVIVVDYPKDIKAFYMRQNEDGKTVAAMDVLFPGIGEVIGGSQREERLEVLRARMAEMDVPEEELWWYLDLRKFGSAPHAGFGLGFERMVQFVTGMGNIRDVIAFPRTPKSAEF